MRGLFRVAFAAVLFAPSLAIGSEPSPIAERPEDTWDLTELYSSVDAWETEFVKASEAVAGLSACNGKLSVQLRDCLQRKFEAQKSVARLNVYASNLANTDTRDSARQARAQRAEILANELAERTANFGPELLSIGAPVVEDVLAKDAAMKPFDYYLRSTLADAPHTLDTEGEAFLAAAANVLGGAQRSRDALVNAEFPWPVVKLTDGTMIELTPPRYAHHRAHPNRADRKAIFDAFFGSLAKHDATLGSTLDTAARGHWLVAESRKYPSSMAAAIDADHIPASVYQALVDSTNRNLPTLHRYLKLRAKMLGVSDLAYYDLYTPLVGFDRKFTIDEAKQLTLESVKPVGPEYTAALQRGFAGRWMDVYPRPGKRPGAYMDGSAYDAHPYLLLNFTGDYDSVSTLTHEWGHAMHSIFSSKAQPYPKADYATFIAEITSTFNEALLLQRMLASAQSDDEKLFYLGHALENLRTTFFRQAQFAEFELAIHTQVEKGQPLTGDTLTATYLGLLKRYYGHDQGITRIDDTYGVEWAYVPHFYYNFYVYQYATSIAASSLLAQDVLAKKKGALDGYYGLLRAGGSDNPYKLLQNAGVDLATPAPYDALASSMNAIMDEMEAILARKANGGAAPGGKGKKGK